MLSIFLIGLALSMDAFSLSLGIGTIGINNYYKLIMSFFVGTMHFIMPIFGLFISDKLSSVFKLNFSLFTIIIFIYTGVIMIIEKKELKQTVKYSIFNLLLLSFSVSIDSFSVGLGLKLYNTKFLIPSIIFFICSSLITYLGLKIGEYSIKHLKEKAPILGGLMFIILAIVNIIKYFS